MQNTHERHCIIIRLIVDGISAMKGNTQAGRKLWALWICQRKGQQAFTRGMQFAKKTGGNKFRGFLSNI